MCKATNTIAVAISIVTCPQMAWAAGGNGITAPTHEPAAAAGKATWLPERGRGLPLHAAMELCALAILHALLQPADYRPLGDRWAPTYTANSTIDRQLTPEINC